MKINVRLLRKIQRAIKKEPKQFDMSFSFTREKGIPNCGTAACIAGWAFAIDKGVNPQDASQIQHFPLREAADLLGLNEYQKDKLFFTGGWPPRFRYADSQERSKEAAKKAVDRINHFIKTKGAE